VQSLLASLNWSPTDDATWTAADLQKLTRAVASLHLMEVFPLFSMLVYADDANSTVNVGHMSQSGLGLPDRAYYLDKDRTTDSVNTHFLFSFSDDVT
jgi:predicted metalloendopeptidase